jgi:hypothetical protein
MSLSAIAGDEANNEAEGQAQGSGQLGLSRGVIAAARSPDQQVLQSQLMQSSAAVH